MNIKHHCFNKALREKKPSCSTCSTFKKRLQIFFWKIYPHPYIYTYQMSSLLSSFLWVPNGFLLIANAEYKKTSIRDQTPVSQTFNTYCACHALNFIDSAGLTHLRITHLKKLNESNEVYKNTWNLSDSYLKVHKLHNILSGINILTTNCRLVQQ